MKLIHFFSDKDRYNLGQPVPIKGLLPEWYRKAESSYQRDDKPMPGLKKCVPFLDAMLSGYSLVTPFDIHIRHREDGSLDITWDGPESFKDYVIERDHKQGETIPRPAGHLPNHLAFASPWGFKTPKGWSILVTHPLNRFELPFTITSGIIDSDEFGTGGNLPFFLRADFQGIIPAGTPIAQIIPIKRADWHHVPNNAGMRHLNPVQALFVRQEGNSYKKKFWHRKKYD
jgi:hypothetical protein